MNLYLVVSESLQTWPCYDPPQPPEDYRIAELVVARSPAQATYLAWRADGESGPGRVTMLDKPRFRVRSKARDVAGPARIASLEYPYRSPYWLLDCEDDLSA